MTPGNASLNRTGCMNAPLLFDVCITRKINRFKRSNHVLNPTCGNSCNVSIAMLGNSEDFKYVIFSRPSMVLIVTRNRNSSEVGDSIVVTNPVDVVNMFVRESPINIKECESMCFPQESIDANNSIAVHSDCSCNGTGFSVVASGNNPRKRASLSVVAQKLFETLLRQCRIEIAHAVRPRKTMVWEVTPAI